jgi:hypothetical protein
LSLVPRLRVGTQLRTPGVPDAPLMPLPAATRDVGRRRRHFHAEPGNEKTRSLETRSLGAWERDVVYLGTLRIAGTRHALAQAPAAAPEAPQGTAGDRAAQGAPVLDDQGVEPA